jgi:hypothetical protein
MLEFNLEAIGAVCPIGHARVSDKRIELQWGRH